MYIQELFFVAKGSDKSTVVGASFWQLALKSDFNPVVVIDDISTFSLFHVVGVHMEVSTGTIINGLVHVSLRIGIVLLSR